MQGEGRQPGASEAGGRHGLALGLAGRTMIAGADGEPDRVTTDTRGSSWTTRLQLFGGLALGLGMLAWFLGGLDWNALWRTLQEVSWTWVAIAALVMLADYGVHALRWRLLLKHVDPDLDLRTLWAATTVMWGFNTLLPLRAGNFLRPAVVALRRNLPYTTLLFTMIAEYVCDIFGIVLLVLWMIWLLPPDMVQGGGLLADIKVYGTWAGVAALVSLGVVVLLSTRQARVAVQAMLRPLPDALETRAILLFDQLVMGMAAVNHPLKLLWALVLTMAIWGGWLLAILATFRAFDLDLPLVGALFMESALTLSMLVPQAPGFLGVFQVVTEEALGMFDAPQSKAEGIALVFWTVCFVPVTLLGLWDAWKMGLDVSGSGRTEAFEDLERRAEAAEE